MDVIVPTQRPGVHRPEATCGIACLPLGLMSACSQLRREIDGFSDNYIGSNTFACCTHLGPGLAGVRGIERLVQKLIIMRALTGNSSPDAIIHLQVEVTASQNIGTSNHKHLSEEACIMLAELMGYSGAQHDAVLTNGVKLDIFDADSTGLAVATTVFGRAYPGVRLGNSTGAFMQDVRQIVMSALHTKAEEEACGILRMSTPEKKAFLSQLHPTRTCEYRVETLFRTTVGFNLGGLDYPTSVGSLHTIQVLSMLLTRVPTSCR